MADTRSTASAAFANNPSLRETVGKSSLFKKMQDKLRPVAVDGEKYYVAEGDTLLDEDQLAFYARQRETADEAGKAASAADEVGLGTGRTTTPVRAGLLGMTQNGKFVRWKPGVVLSYRVAKNTFPDEPKYQKAVDSVRAATKAWEDTCGVSFEYRAALDSKPGVDGAGALFSVRFFDAQGAFIASAFFPNDPVNRRRVLIDPSFYAADLIFDSIGVLRHELGHVLGFRHEHIRSGAPPDCPKESLSGTVDLTKYDPKSVMHYFCGDVGSKDLKITELDLSGSQMLYGPPLAQVQFVGADE